MTYATRTDMDLRFGQSEIANLASDPDDASVDKVAARLADAGAEIDAVLAREYALPLDGGPWPALTRVQCDLARALLYDDASKEAPTRLRDQSMKLLRAIRDGKSELVDSSGAVAPRRNTAARAGADPVMTDDNLAGFAL